MAAGVIYWAAWRILPGYLGYELVPRKETLEDGTVAHPSGFVPPTGETAFHPLAAKPEDAARRPWTEVLAKKSEAGGEGGRALPAPVVLLLRCLETDEILVCRHPRCVRGTSSCSPRDI